MDILNSRPGSSTDRAGRWLIAALVLAACVRLLLLGAYPVTDATEARYAEIGREMIATGNWVTPQIDPGVPFWGKPPLSTWMTAVSLAAFGVNAFAARLPHFLLGVLTCILIFGFARREGDVFHAWLSAAILATSTAFFLSSGAVMTDGALTLGTTAAMVFFWRSVTAAKPSVVDRYGFFVGLAIGLLAKGPLALVLSLAPVGAWALLTGRIGESWRRLPCVSGGLLTAAIALPWYVMAELRTPGFLDYFIIGEHWRRFTVSGWAGDLYGHTHAVPRGTIWIYAFIGTLPWCLPAIGRWWRRRGEARAGLRDPLTLYLALWMLAPLVFFTLARNILWTYALPGIPAFALLAAHSLRDLAIRSPLRTAAVAGLAPLSVVIVLAAIPASRLNSVTQHALVARYLEERRVPDARLLYLATVPYSAQFYSHGASRAIAFEQARTLTSLAGDLLAMHEADLPRLSPALRKHLEVVGRYGDYLLMRDPG